MAHQRSPGASPGGSKSWRLESRRKRRLTWVAPGERPGKRRRTIISFFGGHPNPQQQLLLMNDPSGSVSSLPSSPQKTVKKKRRLSETSAPTTTRKDRKSFTTTTLEASSSSLPQLPSPSLESQLSINSQQPNVTPTEIQLPTTPTQTGNKPPAQEPEASSQAATPTMDANTKQPLNGTKPKTSTPPPPEPVNGGITSTTSQPSTPRKTEGVSSTNGGTIGAAAQATPTRTNGVVGSNGVSPDCIGEAPQAASANGNKVTEEAKEISKETPPPEIAPPAVTVSTNGFAAPLSKTQMKKQKRLQRKQQQLSQQPELQPTLQQRQKKRQALDEPQTTKTMSTTTNLLCSSSPPPLLSSSGSVISLPSLSDSSTQIHEGKDLTQRSKKIPLRLDVEERKLLAILEGALSISEYTDKIDVIHSYGAKVGKIKGQLDEFLSSLVGLHVAQNASNPNYKLDDKRAFFERIFEIGRRFKILNPDKMRTTYGKLICIMQDIPIAGNSINVLPILTVHQFLESRKATKLLSDPNLAAATACVKSELKSDYEAASINKAKAREALHAHFTVTNGHQALISPQDLQRVLDSLSDSNSHLLAYRHPVDCMIGYLKKYFTVGTEGYSPSFQLGIKKGVAGSKLTHNHTTQFNFVHQSLLLWREIQHNIFHLWECADSDLLSKKNNYKLCNTGQGLNRLQTAPAVASAMHALKNKVQSQVKWVGLDVVHLGDRDVPNALVFIDKYNQVPRILAPMVRVIERLEALDANPNTRLILSEHGGLDKVCRRILCDYFRHGFDGSGSDGGSCIDGRLTSSWNWCSKIEKKTFYDLFLLSGFQGFDGSFRV